MRLGRTVAGDVRLDMRSAAVCRGLTSVVNRHSRVGVATDRRVLLRRVRGRWHVLLGTSIMLAIVVLTTAVLTGSGLRAVRDDLHAARDGPSGRAASSGIGRGSRSAKTIVQLFEESAANIVSGNMNSVSNTHDYERAFAGHGQARIGRVQSGSRRLLNLANTGTSLTNDGADENVGDQETEGVSLR
jgi:hypothetical protein